ncbi:hypothetical protein Nepgr_007018 [Nepenthes gracilis]|uniref:Uncharacterized protein n=1 Tax=Nepenthes gracilis TaxID=150966 RepID=A0AAD3S633_NEPGR|nr:hypothetical protein Nepgr_007018 [Nepenthes gracilis]
MARSGAQKRKAAKLRKQKEAQTSNNNGVFPQETQPDFEDGAAAADVTTVELHHTLEAEPQVSSAPLQALQRSSWKNCCGLLELFRAMTDNLSWRIMRRERGNPLISSIFYNNLLSLSTETINYAVRKLKLEEATSNREFDAAEVSSAISGYGIFGIISLEDNQLQKEVEELQTEDCNSLLESAPDEDAVLNLVEFSHEEVVGVATCSLVGKLHETLDGHV